MNANKAHIPIATVDEANFEKEVVRSQKPVLAAFLAPWSRPCQILAGLLAEVAMAFAENVKVVKVNADDNPDLSLSYDIQSVPTLIFVVDGIARARIVGTTSKEAILLRWKAILGHDSEQPSTFNRKSER